jgi:hypothetical protein
MQLRLRVVQVESVLVKDLVAGHDELKSRNGRSRSIREFDRDVTVALEQARLDNSRPLRCASDIVDVCRDVR